MSLERWKLPYLLSLKDLKMLANMSLERDREKPGHFLTGLNYR